MKKNSLFLQKALEDIKLDDRLFDKLLMHDTRADGTLRPEGEVRISWIKRFIGEYGYSSRQIDIEVPAGRIGRAADLPGRDTVFADIVIYRDPGRTEPFIVMETKPPEEKGGLRQAESYSRNLGAEYHVWHNGTSAAKFYKTARFAQKSELVGDVPAWVGSQPVITKVPKTKTLPSFRDEKHMREVVHRCHEIILEQQGHDPAKAFDELTKLLFLKLYDEREVPHFYEFMVVADDTVETVASRLRELFKTAISASRYRDVFQSKYLPRTKVALELDDFTIFQVVKLLQGYSLVHTTGIIHGADIKGTVFEQMVGNTFRGELAQFFTPRELVKCIVDMIPPGPEDTVLDPACGSGGFLIMAIRALRESLKTAFPNLGETQLQDKIGYFAANNLFGADINDRMARVAKMNMIMHGDGHAGIANVNGLSLIASLPTNWEYNLDEGKFDIVYSNPPFAGREKDPTVLERYELGKNKDGKVRSVSKEVLFIEMILRRLKPGGRAGLVLPAGIFNNPSMKHVRDYIKSHSKIIGLVGIPHLAFQISGANNEGHLLLLEKVDDVPDDYPIFIDWATAVGIDSIGQKIEQNDLIGIAERFHNPPARNIIRFRQLKERIDPWYYHPNYARIIEHLSVPGHPWRKMREIFSESPERVDRDSLKKGETVRYIEKNNVDLEAGVIHSFSEHTASSLPGRATYVLRENDVLFPDIYDSMRGVAVVPPEYAGYICTNRFFVLRHNPELISLDFIRHIFKRPEILALIKRECSGEINPGISKRAFFNLRLPIPPLDEQERVLSQVREIEQQKLDLYRRIEELNRRIDERLSVAVPDLIGNYEDIKIVRAEYIGSVQLGDGS